MRIMLVTVALLFAVNAAYAQNECDQVADDAWMCPLPTKPAGPPKCQVVGKNLFCTAPVDFAPPVQSTKPVNCGWNKKGAFVCW